ncbi:Zinc finger (C3HC4-type RING finger) family protein [Raphanus sativus]|nr:Zinc finger (C3HC4-type RING finger) family protein [Raphanus sativus]
MENSNNAMKSNEGLNLPKILDPSSTDDTSRSSVDSIIPDPSAPPPPIPSSKNECAICLDEIKKGDGKAIFTAECSHSFHFDCITANVTQGNRICPLCRTQWTQVPSSFLDNSRPPSRFHIPVPVPVPAQMGFEDDELLPQGEAQIQSDNNQQDAPPLEVKLLPQVSAVAKQVALDDFAVLVHLKAGVVMSDVDETPSRAPLDLVAVLDVSSSMDGPKMELLKNAVCFVIQNLGETDRLSVVSFSSTARRLFPLRLMSEAGKQAAIQAVNSLVANGCTNIAEGLEIGARVIAERRWRNPVPVMMLLSDGQDNFTFSQFGGGVHDENRLRVSASEFH